MVEQLEQDRFGFSAICAAKLRVANAGCVRDCLSEAQSSPTEPSGMCNEDQRDEEEQDVGELEREKEIGMPDRTSLEKHKDDEGDEAQDHQLGVKLPKHAQMYRRL